MDEASRKERIANLIKTLRTSGIATTDAQAKSMAEDMITIETKVQSSFDEDYARHKNPLKLKKETEEQKPQIQEIHVQEMPKVEGKALKELFTNDGELHLDRVTVTPDDMPIIPLTKPAENLNSEKTEEITVVNPEIKETAPEEKKESEEEDENIAEFTKEIPAEPTVKKPKEEYEENKIDLTNIFNVNK